MPHSAPFQRWIVEKPYLDICCQLGEGPYYERSTNSLRFVDIKDSRIYNVSLTRGPVSLSSIQLDVAPTVTADVDGHNASTKILVGVKYGAVILDRETGKYKYVAKFGDCPNERIRSNDGAVGPNGELWLGTMTDFGYEPFRAEGSLFRFGGKCEELMTGFTIPNGIGWSPDRRTMYFVHSSARQILAFDYSTPDGTVSNQRLFHQHNGSGEPDGLRIDVDGNLWLAIYGEGCVVKLSHTGELVGEVRLPTRNVTCPQFVGTELFITTGADDQGDEGSRKYGGSVFRINVGSNGLEPFLFKI